MTQIGDRSSEFYPNVNQIRREGSFVYESFVETQGTDVKVRERATPLPIFYVFHYPLYPPIVWIAPHFSKHFFFAS